MIWHSRATMNPAPSENITWSTKTGNTYTTRHVRTSDGGRIKIINIMTTTEGTKFMISLTTTEIGTEARGNVNALNHGLISFHTARTRSYHTRCKSKKENTNEQVAQKVFDASRGLQDHTEDDEKC